MVDRMSRIRRTILATAPVAALVALAVGLPATSHASVSWPDKPGYSDQFQPAGTGSGRRFR
jgi:hypothetical protein